MVHLPGFSLSDFILHPNVYSLCWLLLITRYDGHASLSLCTPDCIFTVSPFCQLFSYIEPRLASDHNCENAFDNWFLPILNIQQYPLMESFHVKHLCFSGWANLFVPQALPIITGLHFSSITWMEHQTWPSKADGCKRLQNDRGSLSLGPALERLHPCTQLVTMHQSLVQTAAASRHCVADMTRMTQHCRSVPNDLLWQAWEERSQSI